VEGAVYLATTNSDESTQLVLAIKKSRMSKRVKRPSLKHEARVLQLLRGHPAIPSVYGYGRFRHFEYLAMELLASTLEDLHKNNAFPLRAVLAIGNQMVNWLSLILFNNRLDDIT
jgi:serine/threonine protein kinase